MTQGLLTNHPGDGPTVVRFLHALSQYYQGLEPLDTPPFYGPNLAFTSPSVQELEEIGEIPNFQDAYPIDSVPPPVTDSTGVKERMVSITQKIHMFLVRIREIEYLKSAILRAGSMMRETAVAQMGHDFSPRPGFMAVNSTWKLDWTSAHFGFSGQIAFYHTTNLGPRYVKVIKPNPTTLADGTWKDWSRGVDVTVSLFRDVKDRFEGFFWENARELGVLEDIQFIL